MRTEIYTLTKADLPLFKGLLPEYVSSRTQKKGYFTLGAIGVEEEKHILLGMAQFHSGITDNGEYYVELVYVYVVEEYRRSGIGTKLLDRVRTILRKSGVKTLTLLIPAADKGDFRSDLPVASLEKFFGELGFTLTKADFDKWESFLREEYPDLTEKDVKRYIKMIKVS